MNEQQDNAPYAGHYAGSAIRLTTRRTSAAPQEQPTRKRYAAQPEPSHRQGHSFGIHPADDTYDTDSFDIEGQTIQTNYRAVAAARSAMRRLPPGARPSTCNQSPPKSSRTAVWTAPRW